MNTFIKRLIYRLIWAQKEFIGNVKTEKIYDELARKNQYDMVVDFTTRSKGFIKALQILQNSPKKALDLASGTGAMIDALLSIGTHQIIGTDISEKMLEIAKKRFEKYKNISYIKQDFLADTFGNQTFDLITLCFAARFIPKEKEEHFAKLITKLLEKNGKFVIITMNSPEKVFYEIIDNFFGYPKGMNVLMDNEDHLKKLLGKYLTFEKSVHIQTQFMMYQTKALLFRKK